MTTSARRRASTTTQPAPTQTAPPPAMQQSSSSGGGMLSGIGSTIAQGMAFGTGSAIAHRAVGAVANSFGGGGGSEQSAVQAEQQQQQPQQVSRMNEELQGPCAQDKQMFFECLKINQGDQQSCSFLYQTLQECQRNQSQMSFQ
jgi:hypothetical protein